MKVIKNDKTAELVGLSFGDGSLTRRKDSDVLRFQLRGDVSEDRDHYFSHIIPLFNEQISKPLLNKDVPTVTSKPPYASFGIAIQNNIVGELLSQLGIPIGRKEELNIPSWIKGDRNYLISFIRGLFDIIGIKNYIKIQRKKIEKDAYHIEVSGGINVEKWFQIIGSNNSKHVTKFLVWKKFGFCPPYTNLKQRQSFLSGELIPDLFYAGMGERSNPLEGQKPGELEGLVP